MLAAVGYGWFAYGTLDSSISRVAGVRTHDTPGAAQNVLLIGDDHRPANASPQVLAQLSTQQDGGGINTDTMMVLHMPAGSGRPTVISLPRDSWVPIPGFGKGKLNAAFADGAASGGGDAAGISLLIRTIEGMTGLTIDHFVRVSLLGFYDIAQALGPIQVCLNNPVNDPYSGLVLPAGVSTLDAKQALSFVRQRHGLPRGDLDREVRQQYFLSVELRKVTSSGVLLNPVRLKTVLSAVGSAVQTDPGLNLLQFAQQFSQIASGAVRYATIPVLGTPTIQDASGQSVSIVAVDWAALPAFIASVIGPPAAYTDAAPAAPSAVRVTVLNGTGEAGLAAAQARALTGLGFSVAVDATGTTSTQTAITYPAGLEGQAKALAAVVPGAVVAESPSVPQVTLTLGPDGHRVRTGTAAASPASPAAGPAPSPAPVSSAPSTFPGSACVN